MHVVSIFSLLLLLLLSVNLRSAVFFSDRSKLSGWNLNGTKVARRRRPAEAQCTRSLGLGCKLCAAIPVAGKRTHGTTFRALKVTPRAATPGAESAVYDCLVVCSKQRKRGGRCSTYRPAYTRSVPCSTLSSVPGRFSRGHFHTVLPSSGTLTLLAVLSKRKRNRRLREKT